MGAARGWGFVVLAALFLGQIYALYLYVPAPGPGAPYLDKVAHLLTFGVPAAVAAALRLRAVLVLLVLHAVISEPLQALLPVDRGADVLDLVADLMGIVVGMLIGWGVAARWDICAARRESRLGSEDR
ncbi:MAG: VanZ family protein [Ornithinimicrobium sp.]